MTMIYPDQFNSEGEGTGTVISYNSSNGLMEGHHLAKHFLYSFNVHTELLGIKVPL